MECVAAEEDNRRLTQLRFDAAVKVIKSLPPDGPFQPSNDMMLKFYSYYKQATVGVCNIPRPGFWDAVGKAKWDAWSSLGNMSKEEAMVAYVDEMKLILEGMPMTDEVEELLRVLGPFYELIEEKKKILHVSDLSTGFGTTLNAFTSKSVAKDLIRTLERNGTLEMHPAQHNSKEAEERLDSESQENEEEDEDVEENEEEEVVEMEMAEEPVKDKKSVAQRKESSSSRRHKPPLSNGKVANGVTHLTNGSHFKAENHQDEKAQLNGHHSDVPGPSHLASDSDSEVYCDSVDQFGQDEISDRKHLLDDLEEGESQPPEEEMHELQLYDPSQVVRCGGEDGDSGRPMSQRQRSQGGMCESSLARRGRGSKSPALSAGFQVPMQSGGDGDGSRRGMSAAPGGSLNEQIVVALARLQDDMQSVLERLHTLEALTASQARSMSLSPAYASHPVNKRSQRPSWWPFDISPTSLAFAVIWPFVAQWLIRLFMQRRRRPRK